MKKALEQLLIFQLKFSKAITVVCLGMDVLLSFFAMACHLIDKPVDSSTLAVLFAPWNVELGFNMAITLWDKKHEYMERKQ